MVRTVVVHVADIHLHERVVLAGGDGRDELVADAVGVAVAGVVLAGVVDECSVDSHLATGAVDTAQVRVLEHLAVATPQLDAGLATVPADVAAGDGVLGVVDRLSRVNYLGHHVGFSIP